MGVLLFSPDSKVSAQIIQMGYNPEQGLGKHQEGIKYPFSVKPNKGREDPRSPQDLTSGPLQK